jgi:hypothetical protein
MESLCVCTWVLLLRPPGGVISVIVSREQCEKICTCCVHAMLVRSVTFCTVRVCASCIQVWMELLCWCTQGWSLLFCIVLLCASCIDLYSEWACAICVQVFLMRSALFCIVWICASCIHCVWSNHVQIHVHVLLVQSVSQSRCVWWGYVHPVFT